MRFNGTQIDTEETHKLWKELKLFNKLSPKDLKYLLSINLNETEADKFNAGLRNIKPLQNFSEVFDQTGEIITEWI